MRAPLGFGHWLRQRRRQLDLTQAELAALVGCSIVTIRKLESDDRVPSRQIAERLARCLKIAPDQVLAFVMFARGRSAVPPTLDMAQASPAGLTGTPLPTPITALLGRERDLAELRRLIDAPEVRLITIVGPPGIGKTRLSLQLAASIQSRFADGVFFVPLAPVSDPTHVLPTITRVLGLPDRGVRPSGHYDLLHHRQLLLVLDNFEQVSAAAPLVSELLQMAPHAKAIVTSRIALRVSGEQQYAVPPLALPDPRARLDPRALSEYPAVQLFVARMRVTHPGFELSAENAPAVAEICARLDGLPLAIELAVARSRLLTPQALLERLRGPSGPNALDVLVSGPGDLLDHQRTLRSTIQWSYDLLTPEERRVFMRLGVFVGEFTAGAAEAVCADAPFASAAPHSVHAMTDIIESLVNQHLVTYAIEPDGAAQFQLLETIREFASERLTADGALDEARRRHAQYYIGLARAAAPHLDGADQERWLQTIQSTYTNLDAALAWFCENAPEIGLRCASDLGPFWHTRGYLSDGRAWLDRLLTAIEAAQPSPDSLVDETSAVRAYALHVASFLAFQQGDNQQAATLAQASLALYRELGDEPGIATALMAVGRAAFGQANYPEATAMFEESLRINHAQQNWNNVAQALSNLALISKDQGDYVRAVRLQEESLALYRRIGNRRGQARVLNNMSIVAYWQGDYERAGMLAHETAAIDRELRDRMGLAYALDVLGMVAYKQGRLDHALSTLAESLELFRALNERVGMAMVLNETGLIALAQGEHVVAARTQREALQVAWSIGDVRRVAFCLEGLAAALGPEQPADAARLFGAAERLRETIGAPLPESEQVSYTAWVMAARGVCPPELFESAWQAGRAQPLDQAVSSALGETQ